MHSPVQIVAFHHSDTIRSETSQPPCSQKYAMKYVLNPIYNQWHPTNSMVPQPTVRMVQGWMCWPMESGVVDFRRPFSMWECLTPLLPLTETRHRHQSTWSINLRRSWPISNGYKKWSTPLLLPLFFQPQEVWAKKPPLFISVKHSWLARKKDSSYSMTSCWLRCHLSYSLLRSFIQAIRGDRSSQRHAARSHTAIDLITTESHIQNGSNRLHSKHHLTFMDAL